MKLKWVMVRKDYCLQDGENVPNTSTLIHTVIISFVLRSLVVSVLEKGVMKEVSLYGKWYLHVVGQIHRSYQLQSTHHDQSQFYYVQEKANPVVYSNINWVPQEREQDERTMHCLKMTAIRRCNSTTP